MIRAIITGLLSTTALLGSVSAFGDGPPCQGLDTKMGPDGKMGPGNCVKKSDCTTNEWLFGTSKDPVCDVAGSDYKLPTTKVCCFDAPPGAAANEAAVVAPTTP
jgi:hypothetical protein